MTSIFDFFTSHLQYIVPTIGTLVSFISTMSIIDVEKILLPREKRLLLNIKIILKVIFIYALLTSYLSIIVYSCKPQISPYIGNIYLYTLITIAILFFLCIIGIMIINTDSTNNTTNIIRENVAFKKSFTFINCLLLFLSSFLCIFAASLLVANYMLNKAKDIKANIIIAIILFIIFFIVIRIYEFTRLTYTSKHYKILALKTNDGIIYKDLYLYSLNENYLFLGKTPKQIKSKECLVFRKDFVNMYHIEEEKYKWDTKISP